MANFNKDKNYHFIYKTTNRLNNEYYIGMHSTNKLNDGYMGSGKRLRRSLKKYGKENFTFEILEYCESRELLVERETVIVNEELISDEKCMNLKTGGFGGLNSLPEESLSKIRIGSSKWLKKQWQNPEYRKRISEISSEKMKRLHKKGKIKYDTFTGKKHSKESKEKMSKSSKGIGLGDKNSQFGTMWITNGYENKKMLKELNIPTGWKRGRVMNKK